ncbi:MAG: hypothetical protein MZW92_30560 [Comamonadaceae bacterium]|nr:hypothetical protein [Comamonadaceae bacterium]
MPADAILTVLCSIFQSDYRETIGRLQRPTLLLQTREDIAVPLGAAQLLHARIAGSRLEIRRRRRPSAARQRAGRGHRGDARLRPRQLKRRGGAVGPAPG